MPVKSKRQWRWIAANNPEMLKKWQKESPVNYKDLPENFIIQRINRILEQHIKIQMPTPEMFEFFYQRTQLHRDLVKENLNKIIESGFFTNILDNSELKNRGVVHDISKYSEPEFIPYVWNTEMYRCKNNNISFTWPQGVKEEANKATLHHVENNRHHPEFYSTEKIQLDPNNRDKALKAITISDTMSNIDLCELVSDWKAMSEELNQDNSGARNWFNKNDNVRWIFTPYQKDLIYKIIDILEK